MFFGVGNLRIMMLYKKARKLALEHGAAIIFIDELDAIGVRRSGAMGTSTMGMFGAGLGLLNELLLQMDPPNLEYRLWAKILRRFGMRPKPGPQPVVLLTIGATNLPEALDSCSTATRAL
jgi:cell division protease FtsH